MVPYKFLERTIVELACLHIQSAVKLSYLYDNVLTHSEICNVWNSYFSLEQKRIEHIFFL